MKKNSIKERANKVPEEVKRMVDKSMATAKEIDRILKQQGKTQQDLAHLLGKKESEISKWLRGTHNFTFKTICKIEIALKESIILLPHEAVKNIYILASIKAGVEQSSCIKTKKEQGYTILKEKESIDFNFNQHLAVTHGLEDKLNLSELLN